ncbi:hypothetical protein BSK53_02840 [Paenibacillus odorifer]|nr:hypothetical protein BSK53_02840 [Paenibacillus odorifer]
MFNESLIKSDFILVGNQHQQNTNAELFVKRDKVIMEYYCGWFLEISRDIGPSKTADILYGWIRNWLTWLV